MISAIGRKPIMAAPSAAPMIAVSLIGVSRTRSSPNSFIRSPLTPQTPPKVPTSSPMRMTFGSRAISSRMVS